MIDSVQELDVDPIVDLYTLSLIPIGGTEVFRFVSNSDEGGVPTLFGGQAYSPVDIEVTGFDWDGSGQLPSPRVLVSNVSGVMTAAIVSFGDIIGAEFTRIRTFEKHLDTGEFPDSNAIFPPEIYTVNQRIEHNKVFIEYELKSIMEQLSVKLPKRQCIRETCTHRYRIFDPDTQTFNYSDASCPYVGGQYFDENGNPTTASNDKCGRKIGDCRLRFGANNPLPTRAFPGITKLR